MADPFYELEGSNKVEPNASAWWSVPQLKAINPREIVHRFTDREYVQSDVAFKRLEPYLLSAQATANPKANEPASIAPASSSSARPRSEYPETA